MTRLCLRLGLNPGRQAGAIHAGWWRKPGRRAGRVKAPKVRFGVCPHGNEGIDQGEDMEKWTSSCHQAFCMTTLNLMVMQIPSPTLYAGFFVGHGGWPQPSLQQHTSIGRLVGVKKSRWIPARLPRPICRQLHRGTALWPPWIAHPSKRRYRPTAFSSP